MWWLVLSTPPCPVYSDALPQPKPRVIGVKWPWSEAASSEKSSRLHLTFKCVTTTARPAKSSWSSVSLTGCLCFKWDDTLKGSPCHDVWHRGACDKSWRESSLLLHILCASKAIQMLTAPPWAALYLLWSLVPARLSVCWCVWCWLSSEPFLLSSFYTRTHLFS